jgi:hypothetical protein
MMFGVRGGEKVGDRFMSRLFLLAADIPHVMVLAQESASTGFVLAGRHDRSEETTPA